MPPPGRFTAKYKAYIGKLLTWEHTRLPYASYVMLPVFFEVRFSVQKLYLVKWVIYGLEACGNF